VIPNPYRQHYQVFFREQALDTDRPLWDRLAFLAWGSARRNGHANFGPGELAHFFNVRPDKISNALKIAKDKGLIGPGSKPRCLVVPERIAEGGEGSEWEICGVCDGRRIRSHPVKRDRFARKQPGGTRTEIAIRKALQRS
jgi:hypothetical protein